MNPLDAIGAGLTAAALAGVWAVRRTLSRSGPERAAKVLANLCGASCVLVLASLFLAWATQARALGSLGALTAGVFALLLVTAGFWASSQGGNAAVAAAPGSKPSKQAGE